MTHLTRCISAALALSVATLLPLPFAFAEGESPEGIKLRAASYDGKWSGVINCLYDPGLWPNDECDIGLTFEIRGRDIAVTQIVRTKTGEETKSDVDPGRFEFFRLAVNAIAIAIETGKDEDGTWVETWSFAMTLKDADHMIVHWTRVVNNIDMPLDKPASKFSSVGMGEMVRAGSAQ
jgi:hypothetical protein